jgi:hypothetical protein
LEGLPTLPSGRYVECPECGSASQKCDEVVIETIGADDHFAALNERKDKPIWFSESERQGRAADATLLKDDSYSYSLIEVGVWVEI